MKSSGMLGGGWTSSWNQSTRTSHCGTMSSPSGGVILSHAVPQLLDVLTVASSPEAPPHIGIFSMLKKWISTKQSGKTLASHTPLRNFTSLWFCRASTPFSVTDNNESGILEDEYPG